MLGRWTSSEPERLPLDRPKPCGLGRQMTRSLFTGTASVPHPVACCERDLPRHRLASHVGLSVRLRPRVASQRLRAERCASPTSATDSPNEHPLDCPIPDAPATSLATPRWTRAAFGQRPPAASRVEPRLTATLQLRPSNDSPKPASRTVALMTAKVRTPRGPGEASITASPRSVSRRRRFQPHTELEA